MSFEALPTELHLEIVTHLREDESEWPAYPRPSCISLSECSHRWRSFCLPVIFEAVQIGLCTNEALTRFVEPNGAKHGYLFKKVTLYYPHRQKHQWDPERCDIIGLLIPFLINLTHLFINIYPWIDGHNSSQFQASLAPLLDLPHLRHLILHLLYGRSLPVLGPIIASCTHLTHIEVLTSSAAETMPINFWDALLSVTQIKRVYLQRLPLPDPQVYHYINTVSIPELLLFCYHLDAIALSYFLSEAAGTLHRLTIDFETHLPLDLISSLPPISLPKLERLELINCWSLNAEGFTFAVQLFRETPAVFMRLVPHDWDFSEFQGVITSGCFPKLRRLVVHNSGLDWSETDCRKTCAARNIELEWVAQHYTSRRQMYAPFSIRAGFKSSALVCI